MAYAKKWLQYHRVKHSAERVSRTLPGGKSIPEIRLRISLAGEEEPRELRLLLADTRDTDGLMRRQRVNALVADLPYGVQHAPKENGRMSTLEGLLADCLPAWRQALLPGCAAAIAFNTYTLRRDRLAALAKGAGFRLPETPEYAAFSHWVEPAVNRDVLIALAPSPAP